MLEKWYESDMFRSGSTLALDKQVSAPVNYT